MNTQGYIQDGKSQLNNTDHYEKRIMTPQTDTVSTLITLLIKPEC